MALIANSASVNSKQQNIFTQLQRDETCSLTALFTPEHGFSLRHDDKVKDGKYHNIPVYSLYGPRKAPTADQLQGVDVILFDLQDVGLRYYTYTTTLALVMQSAAKQHIPVVLLDRVNPLGGKVVNGAILAKNLTGHFEAYYPLPTRYGLTMGELAKYYNRYFKLGADLTVVPLAHWRRSMTYPQTTLTWRAPSPALPTFMSARLYAAFGPLETLALSVGRSRDNKYAFRRYGAPWISADDAKQLTKSLNDLHLRGLKFSTIKWTPNRAKYKGKVCRGFVVRMTAPDKVDDFASLLAVTNTLRQQFGRKIQLANIDRMLGSRRIRSAIAGGKSVNSLVRDNDRRLETYRQKRQAVLLYR